MALRGVPFGRASVASVLRHRANERSAVVQGEAANDTLSPNGNYFVGGPTGWHVSGTGEGGAEPTAIYDTHEFGYDGRFDVICRGGIVGLQIRSRRVRGTVLASGQSLAGVNLISTCSDVELDVEVSGVPAGASNKAVGIAGTDCTIRGRIHHNGCLGVALASTAVRPRVHARIHDNGDYGIQDLGATAPVVSECEIPKSATQAVAVLGLGATGVVRNCLMLGWGTSTLPFTTINAAAKIHNVMTDAGAIGNQAFNIGNPTVAPTYDSTWFRGGFAQIRTGGSIRVDKAMLMSGAIDTTGKTSAQIDAAFAALTGFAATDSCITFDDVNGLFLRRAAGKWRSFSAGSPIA